MKPPPFLLAVYLLAASATTWADIEIPTVLVGDPGNPSDPNSPDLYSGLIYAGRSFGSVPYEFHIGTHEVTNAEYAAFLNAVAASDPLNLYDPRMGGSDQLGPVPGGIRRLGSSGNYTYHPLPYMADKPVNWVSFLSAARFANWLTNGQPAGGQNPTATESGMYSIVPLDSVFGLEVITRTRDFSLGESGVAVPNLNEWYKAAFYSGSPTGADGDGYWRFPGRSTTIATATATPTGDIANPGWVANYGLTADWNGLDGNVTTVGSGGPDAASHYGAFDMFGNVEEWLDEYDEEEGYLGLGERRLFLGYHYESPQLEAITTHPLETAGFERYRTTDRRLGFRVVSNAPILRPDLDGDNLPDGWEMAQFGELTTTDGSTDTDGDGLDDLAEFHAGSNPNIDPATVTHVELYTFHGENAGDAFGAAVSGAGDVNGDGFADLLVGAPMADANGIGSGSAHVFSGLNGGALAVYNGDGPGEQFGTSVSGLGDLNGDSASDILVGAWGGGANSGGYARVFSGQNGSIRNTFNGAGATDQFGRSVRLAGDFDGDTFPDLILGAPFDDGNGSNSGSARLVSGFSAETLHVFDGSSSGDQFGGAVSGAGDVDADGLDDVIVGASFADPNGANSGSVRILSGRGGSVLYTFNGDGTEDRFGHAVSGAGDVNGDGFDDVIVGAYLDDNNGTGSGSARVLSGQDGSMLYTFDGSGSGDELGWSVSAAGDINGDGFDDVIVGARNGGLHAGGYARVFSGVDGSILHTFHGESAGDVFGHSVSSAGDVNGDGLSDLIVGARNGGINGGGYARVFVSQATGTPRYDVTLQPGVGGSIVQANNGADFVVELFRGQLFPEVTVADAPFFVFLDWSPELPAFATSQTVYTAQYEADDDDDGIGNSSDPDSDGDGILDDQELSVFGDLTTANDLSDWDGDGWSDRDEFFVGTDPTDGGSFLRTWLVLTETPALRFAPAVANLSYRAQWKADLTEASWHELGLGWSTPIGEEYSEFSLPTSLLESNPALFMRIVVEPE